MLLEIFNKNEEEKLYFFSSSKLRVEFFYQFEDEFIVTLEYAVDNYESLNPNLKFAGKKFLDYFSFLIRKPSDFLIINKFKSPKQKEYLLKLLCDSRILSDELLYSLFRNKEVVNSLPNGEWLECCARRFVKVLIDVGEGRQISWTETFPNDHEISDFTKKYIYSWIYESGQMDDDFQRRFKNEFPEKYGHLSTFVDRQ